jgi:hypothetical protein
MKIEAFIGWGVIVVIALLIWLQAACGGGQIPTPSHKAASTPNGIAVVSQQPIPADVLPEIDKQYQDLLDIASSQYEVYPAYSNIKVQILPVSPLCDNISFLITQSVAPGTNYDGSVFDKDGQVNGQVSICAAGRFLEPETVQVTVEGIRTAPVVRYELEHWLLYRVDRQRYLQTAYHYDAGHPIL